MSNRMRTLAIDLGERRVGLALSDAGGKLASPYDVVEVTSARGAADSVLQVIRDEGVERVVLGMPLNMDDSIGPAAKKTIAWGRELSAESGKPVLFVDERLSSFAAEQTLIERKRGGERITRRMKKQRLDAVAAAQLLQAFLDGKLGSVPLENLPET
jgi:putative Holliday junction resolvase